MKRYACILVDRPAGWSPQSPLDVPPTETDPSGRVAATQFMAGHNVEELDNPTGKWAVVVLTPEAKGGAA